MQREIGALDRAGGGPDLSGVLCLRSSQALFVSAKSPRKAEQSGLRETGSIY